MAPEFQTLPCHPASPPWPGKADGGIAEGPRDACGADRRYWIVCSPDFLSAHRTRELGVRMPVGAESGPLLRAVMEESLVLIGVGI